MNKTYRIFIVLSFLLIAFASTTVLAQEQRERGLEVKVGATPDEAKANRPVQLWAVLIAFRDIITAIGTSTATRFPI